MLEPQLSGGGIHPLAFFRHPVVVVVSASESVAEKVEKVSVGSNVPVRKDWQRSLSLESSILNDIIGGVVREELQPFVDDVQQKQKERNQYLNDILLESVINPEVRYLLELTAWREFGTRWNAFQNPGTQTVLPPAQKLDSISLEKITKASDYDKSVPVAMETLAPWTTTPWNQLLRHKSPPKVPEAAKPTSTGLKDRILVELCSPIAAETGAVVMEKDLERLDKQERITNPPRYV